MAQIASLPTLKVEIAFNPTDISSLTQTWTDVTLYVRDLSTHGGRQHYLDRIESSNLSMTLDNRTGFFMNGTVNGSGSVVRARLPIRVTATWSSTPYSVFWGTIDTIETHLEDALNSDLYLSASDSLKFLSLRYAWNENLYATYANIASTRSWYAQPTNASLPDQVGSYNGFVTGSYQLTDGVLLYSRSQAIDMTNGTQSTNTADCNVPVSSGGDKGIEFWVIGQGLGGATLSPISYFAGLASGDYTIKVANNGTVYTPAGTTPVSYGITTKAVINDGEWHHIALYTDGGGMNLMIDGVVYTDGVAWGSGTILSTASNSNYYSIGSTALCYIDQVIVLNASSVNSVEIQNRYIAGSLLRNDRPTGDRVAEALVVGGRGSIASGALSLSNYYINGSAYTPYSASNGTVLAQGSTAPLYNSTILDIIYDSVDTETGVFYQGDDGTLNFLTKSYPYRAAANATPTGAYVWTDDTTSNYHYEAPSFQLTRDDVDVWTTVIISPTNGTQQIYSAPSATQLLYGQSTLTRSTSPTSNEAAKQTGAYLGYLYSGPLPRANQVELRSETDNGSNLDAMLGVNLQDVVTIKRTPINASAAGITNTQMLVESINHEFSADPGFWHTRITLDPYPLRARTQNSQYYLITDNATYGTVWDSGTVSGVTVVGSTGTATLTSIGGVVGVAVGAKFTVNFTAGGSITGTVTSSTLAGSTITVVFTVSSGSAGAGGTWYTGNLPNGQNIYL